MVLMNVVAPTVRPKLSVCMTREFLLGFSGFNKTQTFVLNLRDAVESKRK